MFRQAAPWPSFETWHAGLSADDEGCGQAKSAAKAEKDG
ncbi:putative beta-lactamase [Pseudomonas aeruginosa]|nr:putative beta-lactamase [Pseudomonas aeruginosa]AWF58604.1 putative beta-lactamase [Pseudomonas aeruginosa]AWF63273.1 putative beta-lactamase [Pseudomonas aeruginosa]PRW15174.1 putative beta-lactamase [Pseudomonas aeruginosa]RCH03823.1 putative beta-lactamase [Pseudomonas aeruginosa]